MDSDLFLLAQQVRAFSAVGDSKANFKFEPIAEPSFSFSLQRISHGRDFYRVVTAAIDLKRVLSITVPCAYRENRISLRMHTTEDRMQRFCEELLRKVEELRIEIRTE